MRYLKLMLTFLTVLLACLLAACRAPGKVIASPLVDEVRTALGSTRADVPRLVRGKGPTTPNGAHGVCYDNHILIMDVAPEALDYYVAHELVHWYIDESPYAGLPSFIEEGLADWIACDLTGLLDYRIDEVAQIGTLRIDPRHLLLDPGAFLQLPSDKAADLTRAGFDIVHRLGTERLRVMAQSGAVSSEYLVAVGVR